MKESAVFHSDLGTALGLTDGGNVYHSVLREAFPGGPGKTVLEAGCGSGKLGLAYAAEGCTVYLVDIDPDMVAYAKRLQRAAEAALDYPLDVKALTLDIHRLPEGWTDKFDFVMNEGVLEHWYETDAKGAFVRHDSGALESMARVTKPGGSVGMIVPNSLCEAQRKLSEGYHHHYKGMPEREVPFDPKEAQAMFASLGIESQISFIAWFDDTGHEPRRPEDCRHMFVWGKKP